MRTLLFAVLLAVSASAGASTATKPTPLQVAEKNSFVFQCTTVIKGVVGEQENAYAIANAACRCTYKRAGDMHAMFPNAGKVADRSLEDVAMDACYKDAQSDLPTFIEKWQAR